MINAKRKMFLMLFGLIAIFMCLSLRGGIMYGVFFILGLSCALVNCGIRYYANLFFLFKGKMSAITFIVLYLMRLAIPVSLGLFLIKDSFMSGLIFLLGFTGQFIILPHISHLFILKK